MATFTTNYELHQWEGSDDFLRSDFNEDLAKIDSALGAVSVQAGEATTGITNLWSVTQNNAYNIYNLILQNYYDGKYSGYKAALIFDGFMDESNIAEKSSALIRTQNQLQLYKVSQSSISLGYGTTTQYGTYEITSTTQTATSTGYLSKVTMKTYSGTGSNAYDTVTYSVTVNGTTVLTGTASVLFSTSAAERSFTLSSAVPIGQGDTFYVTVKSSIVNYYIYYNAAGTGLGGTLTFTTAAATSAYLTTDAFSLPESTSMLVWVHHTNGTISFTAGTQALTSEGSATATTADGISCTESVFSLSPSPSETSLAFQLDVDLGTATYAKIYDYGICLF